MKYNNSYFARESTTHYDEGLRIYMLSIYRNMAMALGISALVAYIVGSSEHCNDAIFYSSCLCGNVCAADLHFFLWS
jgi:FtsH-binding integral membrane protein